MLDKLKRVDVFGRVGGLNLEVTELGLGRNHIHNGSMIILERSIVATDCEEMLKASQSDDRYVFVRRERSVTFLTIVSHLCGWNCSRTLIL